MEALVERARIEALPLRWSLKRATVTWNRFEAALLPLTLLLERSPMDPTIYQILSELLGLRGRWHLQQLKGEEAAADLSKARSYADQSLLLNPHMASALQTKGEVLVLMAQSARGAEEKKARAREAMESFRGALEENPLLERSEVKRWAKDAEQMSTGESVALDGR